MTLVNCVRVRVCVCLCVRALDAGAGISAATNGGCGAADIRTRKLADDTVRHDADAERGLR